MNRILLLFVFFVSILIACQSPQENQYALVASQDSLVFELNPQTSLLIKALFPYTDESGREYLTFQNDVEPEILWYDMDSQQYIKTLKLDKEGANGVGQFVGYRIVNENEIYIPESMRNRIDIVNGEGKIIHHFPYNKTSQGKETIPFISLSCPYTPIYIMDHKIYIPQSPNLRLANTIEDSPVTLVLDTITGILDEFDLRFPKVVTSKAIKGSTIGTKTSYSMCFNGEEFLYSFFFDEDISVVSLDGKLRKRIPVKSKYIDKVYEGTQPPSDLSQLAKLLCEIPMYGNLIYDPYREVYYRFVYPKTEVGEGNHFDMWMLGRSQFSIIILNKDFEVLGETLFPKDIYASRHFFIRKDGLYLSTSFVNNPHYNDDRLCFRRIDLVKQK